MRKKTIGIFLAAAVLLAACGGKDTVQKDGQPAATATAAPTEAGKGSEETPAAKGYVYEQAGVTIGVDMDMAELIAALGEPDSYFEAASCAFEGLDKTYTYGSVEIMTYEMNQKDYVSSIYFKDDMVSTKEGVSLFMTKADMIKAYGENEPDELGMYVYERDGMKLQFILSGEEIISIEYVSTVLDAQ